MIAQEGAYIPWEAAQKQARTAGMAAHDKRGIYYHEAT